LAGACSSNGGCKRKVEEKPFLFPVAANKKEMQQKLSIINIVKKRPQNRIFHIAH
jgi:hypothetical protein